MNAKISTITDILTYNVYDYDLVNLWNKVCGTKNYPDDMIYQMEEFEDICGSIAHNDGLITLIEKVNYGEFNTWDSWFWFNGQGNLYSGDNPATDENSPIDFDLIIEYLEQVGDEDDILNKDELVQGFLDEFFVLNDEADRILNELIDREEVNLVTDNWYDVKDIVEELLDGDDEDEDDSEE